MRPDSFNRRDNPMARPPRHEVIMLARRGFFRNKRTIFKKAAPRVRSRCRGFQHVPELVWRRRRDLERVPIGWNHPIDKNTLRFKILEHFRAQNRAHFC